MFVYTTECGISLARQNVTTTDDIKPEASYLHETAAKAFVCKHCNLSHGHMYCCAHHPQITLATDFTRTLNSTGEG